MHDGERERVPVLDDAPFDAEARSMGRSPSRSRCGCSRANSLRQLAILATLLPKIGMESNAVAGWANAGGRKTGRFSLTKTFLRIHLVGSVDPHHSLSGSTDPDLGFLTHASRRQK